VEPVHGLAEDARPVRVLDEVPEEADVLERLRAGERGGRALRRRQDPALVQQLPEREGRRVRLEDARFEDARFEIVARDGRRTAGDEETEGGGNGEAEGEAHARARSIRVLAGKSAALCRFTSRFVRTDRDRSAPRTIRGERISAGAPVTGAARA